LVGAISRSGAQIRCYTLNETCAEKFRCVIQRRQCRDVYDLWNLLDERGDADLYASWHIFEQKAAHKGIDPKRFFDRWNEGLDWYRKRWDAELGDYLGAATPDFDRVGRAISGKVAEVRDYLTAGDFTCHRKVSTGNYGLHHHLHHRVTQFIRRASVALTGCARS
jgi:predicted nucleotidyltransferase component of viral defense system